MAPSAYPESIERHGGEPEDQVELAKCLRRTKIQSSGESRRGRAAALAVESPESPDTTGKGLAALGRRVDEIQSGRFTRDWTSHEIFFFITITIL